MRKIVFHPLLLAPFSLLALFVHNRGQISAEQIAAPAIVLFILTTLFWLATYGVIREWNKSAILTSLVLFFFFSFGHAVNLLLILFSSLGLTERANLFIQSKESLVLAAFVWLALIFLTANLVRKSRSDLRPVSQFLNVFSLVLVGIAASTWITWHIQETNAYAYTDAWQRSIHAPVPTDQTKVIPSIRPNIFYIVLDEYAREDILTEVYGYDNSAFYTYLAEKGFCVAHQSTSNYSQTHLSLASSLNSIYLDDLVNQIGRQSTNRLPLEAMIQDNRLFQRLRAFGYKTIVFASGYTFTEIRTADIFMSPPTSWTGFESTLLRTTLRLCDVRRETTFALAVIVLPPHVRKA
ncbi:MAG: hypothetical protein FJ009_10825 [Chloroflexi bacterium]|nr:hypothetical protein [Chloroflexota bacterium]